MIALSFFWGGGMFPPPDTDLEAKDMVPKGSFRWTYIWAAPALVILVPCICWSQDDAAGKPACTATWDCPQNGLSASCECNAADNTESCSYQGGIVLAPTDARHQYDQ